MNREQRRKLEHDQRALRQSFPERLIRISLEDYPPTPNPPIKAWVNTHFLVQLYSAANEQYPDMMRLSILRQRRDTSGRWADRIGWDELQAIKREVGFADWYAVEVYPPDAHVVNATNIRHLWLLPTPLPIEFGWCEDGL